MVATTPPTARLFAAMLLACFGVRLVLLPSLDAPPLELLSYYAAGAAFFYASARQADRYIGGLRA